MTPQVRPTRRAFLLLLFLWATPTRIWGEIIYAVTSSDFAWQIFWFDSAAPGEPLGMLPLYGDFEGYIYLGIEFDPVTNDLYGFGVPDCQILCPASPVYPAQIDLATGEVSLLGWPDFPSFQISLQDIRIDPAARELQMVGQGYRNYRYSLNDFQLHVDGNLDTPGRYVGIAHTPPTPEQGVETFAVLYPYPLVYPLVPHLARVGGSGQVAVIGPIDTAYYVGGFDISENGTAFLTAFSTEVSGTTLLRLNLETLATEDLGEIIAPEGQFVGGIAVAPEGLGSVLEIPSLSPVGLGSLVLLLAGVAFLFLRASRSAVAPSSGTG